MAVKKKNTKRIPLLLLRPERGTGKTFVSKPKVDYSKGGTKFKTHKIKAKPSYCVPTKGNECYITEFEVIVPLNDMEKIGDKYSLSADNGYYISKNKKVSNSLLLMLDHDNHYRVSKIVMNGIQYIIPKDRTKNYLGFVNKNKIAPDFNELLKMKSKIHNEVDKLTYDQTFQLLVEINLLKDGILEKIAIAELKFKAGKQ